MGLPLAKELLASDYQVKGSTTSVEKLEDLKSFGIDPYLVKLSEEGVEGEIEACLSESEILVLNVPPGLRKNPEGDFVMQMQLLIPYIENSSVEKVIFVSSTSVYGDDESLPKITEDSTKTPDSEAGKQLLQVEELFQKNGHFETTILRFSGLFGGHRHPANFLSEKTNIQNPKAPVNLIHLEDCIGIIKTIIAKEIWNETFNASSTPHPSRQDYYTSISKVKNLPLPTFNQHSVSTGKYIDSAKLERLLDYKFQVKIE